MRHLRRTLAGIVCLLPAAAVPAAPSPCEAPPSQAQLRLEAQTGQARALEGAGGAEVRLTRSHGAFQAAARQPGEPIGLGYGHEYSIFDISPFSSSSSQQGVEPVANGHLHTLYLPLDLSGYTAEGWALRLQPALAVSSNLLKEPGEIGTEALQLNGTLLRRFGGGAGVWEAGLCADHRFGAYRVYPVLSWLWEEGPWSLRLGWPDSRLGLRLGPALRTFLDLRPDGNRWRVHHGELGDSRFVHESWRLGWSLDWRPHRRWSVEFHAATLLESRYEFSLDDGGRYRGESDSPFQVGLSLLWHFTE